MTPTQEKGILALIVLSSFTLRAFFIYHESLWPDEALYLFISRNLMIDPLALKGIDGEWFYQNPPLLMYILSCLMRMEILEPHVLGHLLITAMDTGTILISFFIARKLFDTTTGLISAALLAVNPLHWCTSSRVLLDIPLTFFIYLALLALIMNRHIAFYSLSFVSLLTKYPAATLFFVPLIRKKWIERHPRLWFSAYTGGLIVVIFAVTNSYAIELDQLRYFIRFFSLPNIREIWVESKFFLGVPICFFFIIGIITALRQFAFSPLLSWVILFGTARLFLPWHAFRMPRYTLPLYPAIIIFAAYGGVTVFRFLKARLPKRVKTLAVVSSVFFLYVLSTSFHRGYTGTYYTNENSVGFKAVQAFFVGDLSGAVVLTSSPRQVKYMVPQLDVHDLPGNMDPEQAEDLMKKRNIGFVLLDRWSPHQPKWALAHFSPSNGYRAVFATEHLVILSVEKSNGHVPLSCLPAFLVPTREKHRFSVG